jgi:hypothetical protein
MWIRMNCSHGPLPRSEFQALPFPACADSRMIKDPLPRPLMYRTMLNVFGDQIHPGFLQGGDDDTREAARTASLARGALVGPRRASP